MIGEQVWSDPIPFFRRLTPTDLLVNMYPGYVTLVPAPLPNQVLVPETGWGIYTPRTVAYPSLSANIIQLGWGDFTSAVNCDPNMATLTATARTFALPYENLVNSSRTLALIVGQALNINIADASATYGPIASSTLVSGGSGYAQNDTFEFDYDTGFTGTVLTVAPITGAVRTYRIDAQGSALPPGTNATTATSGVGTGLTISVTPLQGNGYLDISFVYRILTVPYPW